MPAKNRRRRQQPQDKPQVFDTEARERKGLELYGPEWRGPEEPEQKSLRETVPSTWDPSDLTHNRPVDEALADHRLRKEQYKEVDRQLEYERQLALDNASLGPSPSGERGPADKMITQMMETIEGDLKNGVFTSDDLRLKNRKVWSQKKFVTHYSSIGKRGTFREACKRVAKLETPPE
jgi:hypothetical protein